MQEVKMPSTSAERMRLKRQRDRENPDRKFRKLDSIHMFEDVDVSVIIDNDNNIWFKGVDLARALEIQNPNTNVCELIDKKYCKSYEDMIPTLSTRYHYIPNIHPKTTFVNEAGTYNFILRSRKPKAKTFADWIFDNALPEIRNLQVDILEEEYERQRRNYLKGFIYLFTSEELKAENIYKIGYTKNISKRLSQLNVARFRDLLDVFLCAEVEDALKLEKTLHCMFEDSLRRGEFYELYDDDILKIKKVLCIE